MSARLVILIVIGAGLAVYFAVKEPPPALDFTANQDDIVRTVDREKPIWRLELPGEEPEEPAVFDVTVDVDTSTGQNRLVFNISETQGYYAEGLELRYWYTGGDQDLEPGDSPLNQDQYLDVYVKSNETLTTCLELVKPELDLVGGDMGEGTDWAARIDHAIRTRIQDPESFPEVVEDTCN